MLENLVTLFRFMLTMVSPYRYLSTIDSMPQNSQAELSLI